MSPHLKISEIFSLSHSDGKDPSCKDFEKEACRKGAISRQSLCSELGVFLAVHNDLHHEGLALLRQICFRSWGDLGVKTDWNWLFSKLAFFTLSVHICPLSFRVALPRLSWQQFLR